MTFSKTTVLEGFRQTSNLLFKEDGKTPYRDFVISEDLVPEDAKFMEGDWVITVSFTPSKKVFPRDCPGFIECGGTYLCICGFKESEHGQRTEKEDVSIH